MPAVNSGRSVTRIAAAILERVHLLGDDVGGLADRAREHRGRLEDRHLDALEAVEPAHPLERLDHRAAWRRMSSPNRSWVPRMRWGVSVRLMGARVLE